MMSRYMASFLPVDTPYLGNIICPFPQLRDDLFVLHAEALFEQMLRKSKMFLFGKPPPSLDMVFGGIDDDAVPVENAE